MDHLIIIAASGPSAWIVARATVQRPQHRRCLLLRDIKLADRPPAQGVFYSFGQNLQPPNPQGKIVGDVEVWSLNR